ncbi:hypothetical protein [Halarsenatibacter silvermanii]|uniref:Uncharacterized protein n=1 Tax=Halarsenatibacter silvermanii TaxID=321763 RepID=A0A1G9RDS4_9FIRM|nr:hypothetical protein [Halarsenatibacter silvermanii]SDM21374.1 hypothetical protein SAMN04488692_12148 [Halarsenatibacter silvermanii]
MGDSKKEDGFMSNEKLFNMLTDLSKEVNEFNKNMSAQIAELHLEMKKYNNMRDRVEEGRVQIKNLERKTAKNQARINAICDREEGGLRQREKIAWAVAIISAIAAALFYTGVL